METQQLIGTVEPIEAARAERLKVQAIAYEIKVVRTFALRETEEAMMTRPEMIVQFWREYIETAQWFDPDKECLVVFALNRKNRLIGYNLVTLGTATSSLAHPREVLRPCIVACAAGFAIAHNHPSGDPAPSAADLQITRLIRDAGQAVEIGLLDHVVIGRPGADPTGRGYYSFREAGIV
jgi:DNA repair protein RadC